MTVRRQQRVQEHLAKHLALLILLQGKQLVRAIYPVCILQVTHARTLTMNQGCLLALGPRDAPLIRRDVPVMTNQVANQMTMLMAVLVFGTPVQTLVLLITIPPHVTELHLAMLT